MQVIYGRDEVELDAAEAVEVRAIQGRLQSFMGIPEDVVALVNGIEVSPAHLAQPSSTVEFVVKEGHKGIGRVFTQNEYCQLFGLTQRDFELQIQKGLRVMQLTDGTMRITETAVDNFIAGLNGGGDGALLAVIASSLKRIADHVDPPPPDIVDTTYIADKLGCTKVWVAQMALDKLIPPSCIVPGTGNGKPWKFYRSRIDPWIEMR
jgi:hypothetical protein